MTRRIGESDTLANRLNELEYRNRINRVIAAIWEDPDRPLILHELAVIAGFSPYHFHRIFSAFVGETLGEYIRRVRLVNACHALTYTHTSITEIALSSGYDTPASFTKAFRKQYGVSPSQVRATGRPPVLPSTNTINQRRIKMKPEFRDLPGMTVYYATARGSINQDFTVAADKAFGLLCKYVEKNRLGSHIQLCLGISPDDPDVVPVEQQRYEAGFVFNSGVHPPITEEIKVKHIPAGHYVIFMHRGPYSTLWQAWNAIYRDWLPGSGMELRDVAPFEIYLDDKAKTPPEKLRTEICVPIK